MTVLDEPRVDDLPSLDEEIPCDILRERCGRPAQWLAVLRCCKYRFHVCEPCRQIAKRETGGCGYVCADCGQEYWWHGYYDLWTWHRL